MSCSTEPRGIISMAEIFALSALAKASKFKTPSVMVTWGADKTKAEFLPSIKAFFLASKISRV